MKSRLTIAALATTAALGGTCAFLVPAAIASPSAAKTHTLSVTSVQVSQVSSGLVTNFEDKDLNKAGKVVGYDLLHAVFNPKKGTGAVNVVIATSGGFVYGVATATASPVIHGTVTGGTGVFKGAAGTILAKDLNRAGTRSAITVTYHT